MKFSMILLFLVAIVIASISAHPQEEVPTAVCENNCPKILKPVCGFRNQKFKMFLNECIFHFENCVTVTKGKAGKFEYDCDYKILI